MILCLVSQNELSKCFWYERDEELISGKTPQNCAMRLFRERYFKIKTINDFDDFRESVVSTSSQKEYKYNGYYFYFNKQGNYIMKYLLRLYENHIYHKLKNMVHKTESIRIFLKNTRVKGFFAKQANKLNYGTSLIEFYHLAKSKNKNKRTILIIPRNPARFMDIKALHVPWTATTQDISSKVSINLEDGRWEVNFSDEIGHYAEVYFNDITIIV